MSSWSFPFCCVTAVCTFCSFGLAGGVEGVEGVSVVTAACSVGSWCVVGLMFDEGGFEVLLLAKLFTCRETTFKLLVTRLFVRCLMDAYSKKCFSDSFIKCIHKLCFGYLCCISLENWNAKCAYENLRKPVKYHVGLAGPLDHWMNFTHDFQKILFLFKILFILPIFIIMYISMAFLRAL